MAYLDANPPRHQQFRCPRRERPSGIIGVHTAESFPDETGPDTGAENVARFIQQRTSYGSYHLLADSDSIIQLVEFRCVAYHIGTHGLNEHTIGISAATQAAKWNSLGDDWVDATVRNMARAAARAAQWLQKNYGITVPSRRITLAQALRGERGFLAHGDADPDRRTDPGITFPWGDFLGYYADEMNGDDDMTPEQERMLKDIHRQVGSPIESVDGDDWSIGYAVQRLWHRVFGQLGPVESVDGNTWSPSYTTQRLWHRLYDLPALVRTLAEAQDEGLDLDAMLARLDQHAEAASEERAAILAALAGSGPAEAKLAAILEILGVDA